MEQKQYISSKITFYLIVHYILAALATFFLRSYGMATEEYIHSVLYVQLNLILAFPIFMAIFITLKLAAIVILGNLTVEMFASKEAMLLVRYGVSKYYFIQVFKITSTICVTTFGTILFWCMLSGSWIFSILPVFSYILMISSMILLMNIISTYTDYRLTNILAANLLTGILCFIGTINIYHTLFLAISLIFYGSINFLLIRRIRKINYL